MTSKVMQAKILKIASEVWLIAHKAQNALEMYNAVAIHAKEIKESRRHILFWATHQSMCLDAAILNICKLYRKKNSREYSLAKLADLAQLKIELPAPNEPRSNLKRLFSYRDKHLAHKEILSENNSIKAKSLPSYDTMVQLVKDAKEICVNVGYVPPLTDARASNTVKNVIYKMLKAPNQTDNMQSFEEYKKFMAKN